MSVGAVFVASWPGAHAWKSCQSARERCHAHGSLGSKYRDAAASGSLRRSYTGWGPCAKGYVRSVYFQGWLRIGIFPNSRPRNSSWRTGAWLRHERSWTGELDFRIPGWVMREAALWVMETYWFKADMSPFHWFSFQFPSHAFHRPVGYHFIYSASSFIFSSFTSNACGATLHVRGSRRERKKRI